MTPGKGTSSHSSLAGAEAHVVQVIPGISAVGAPYIRSRSAWSCDLLDDRCGRLSRWDFGFIWPVPSRLLSEASYRLEQPILQGMDCVLPSRTTISSGFTSVSARSSMASYKMRIVNCSAASFLAARWALRIDLAIEGRRGTSASSGVGVSLNNLNSLGVSHGFAALGAADDFLGAQARVWRRGDRYERKRRSPNSNFVGILRHSYTRIIFRAVSSDQPNSVCSHGNHAPCGKRSFTSVSHCPIGGWPRRSSAPYRESAKHAA